MTMAEGVAMERTSVAQKAKGISLRFLVVGLIFVVFLFLFATIADEMVLENESSLDQLVFQKLQGITSAPMTKLMLFITFFGSDNFLVPAYLLVIGYFLAFKKNRTLSLDVAAVGISSTIILFTLKDLFHRHRPDDPLVPNVNGFSFPSGHAFCSLTFFGLLIYILWNHKINTAVRWVITLFLFLFACAIAFSRVYLHVHYASDVIAGFCLCFVWLSISFWIMKKYKRKLS